MEEGRHSGNGFRYAKTEKWLSYYGVWGLHENYNNQFILDSFSQDANLFYECFDNILRQQLPSLDAFLSRFENKIGCEIDLDSIKNMPTSAISSVGFSEEEVLSFIYQISKNKEVLYYHFAEGLSTDNNTYIAGKFLSYAVSSIIKNDMSL